MVLRMHNKQFLVDMMLHAGIKQDNIDMYLNSACIIHKETCKVQPDLEKDEYPSSIIESIGAAMRFTECSEYFSYVKVATIANVYDSRYEETTSFDKMMDEYENDKNKTLFILLMFRAQYVTEKSILKQYLSFGTTTIKIDNVMEKLSLNKC